MKVLLSMAISHCQAIFSSFCNLLSNLKECFSHEKYTNELMSSMNEVNKL